MKITIDMENLSSIIEKAVEEVSEESITKLIEKEIDKILERDYANIIEETVTKYMQESVNAYINSYQVVVPVEGDYSLGVGNTEVLTVKEYIAQEIKKKFDDKCFKVKTNSGYYEGERTVNMKDYVMSELRPDETIKHYMESFTRELHRDINKLLTSTYNEALRNAISDVFIDALKENKKFKEINSQLKTLND